MIEMTFQSDFGERLKKAAKEAGLTQDDLSEKLEKVYGIEITKHSISNHYSGQTLPNLKTVKAYCEILGVKSDYLLFGDGEMKADRPSNDILQRLDKCDTKTAILSLADLLFLTPFVYVEFADGSLHLVLDKPDDISADQFEFDYRVWKDYCEQFGKLADLKDMLSNSDKHVLAEKKIDGDLQSRLDSQLKYKAFQLNDDIFRFE